MDNKVLTTMEEVKTYSDPYRLKILNVFHRLGKPATVKEVADEIGELPAKVYYHVKKLEKVGLLTLVETREINGIVAKYYEVFSGEIIVSQGTEEDSPIRQVVAAEHAQHIAALFEQNKQTFIQQQEAGDHSSVQLLNRSIYVSEEEAKALYTEIVKLCEPYFAKRKNKDVHSYDIFTTVVQNPK
ncbi:helix-turn-helix domain-containing protein [Neobacillus mesonae]|nr:helix-turn-helix domain-containing protein [Neobacillus mesonae]